MASKIVSKIIPQTTRYGDVLLPARHLRLCGGLFRDDSFFLDSAHAEADRLVELLGLTANSALLDVGCGYGRLPIGILNRIGEVRLYQGIDVEKSSVDWCNRYINTKHPNFKFLHVDVSNSRYNPQGVEITLDFKLPFADYTFDVIYLFSVFSHMVIEDIKIYLKEFNRLLSKNGMIFLTAFIEEDVPEMSINPEGYRRGSWKGELHCVRYNKNFFENILAENGFKIKRFDYEKIVHGQSAIYLSRS